MAKGYSIRKTTNYYKSSKDGSWKGHSSSIWDSNGYTKTWPSVESAEQAAREYMSRSSDSDACGYIQYCKIYFGKECIKTVER